MLRTKRAKNLEKIKFFFCLCDIYISSLNYDGDTDVNNYIVDSFIPFLNSYLLSNFSDLNKEKSNYPAIDLADKETKKAIQVTTLDTLKKKQSTCEKFINHKLNFDYNELYIFQLKMKSNTRIPLKILDIYKNLNIFNLTDLYNHVILLEDTDIELLADSLNNLELFNKNQNLMAVNYNHKQVNIDKSDIQGFIYDSGMFLGGETDEEDATNIAKTYSDLINKIDRLSFGAKNVLFFVVFKSKTFSDSNLNYMLQGNYISQSVLQNHFGESVINFCNELIDAELMYLIDQHDYLHSFPAVSVYYRGHMIDGNAFNMLGCYLKYDRSKVEKVLLEGDISDLARKNA